MPGRFLVGGCPALLGDALRLTPCETDRLLLADLVTGHDDLDRRLQNFDRHIDKALTDYTAQCRRLETIPGIDHTSACAILSEMGPDPSVFGAASRLAAWAGLCPGNNESAGERRTGRARRGSRTLRAVLVECAHAAARTENCQFQAHHKANPRQTVTGGQRPPTVMLPVQITVPASGGPPRQTARRLVRADDLRLRGRDRHP